jgi:hypothetical protein
VTLAAAQTYTSLMNQFFQCTHRAGSRLPDVALRADHFVPPFFV